MALCSLLLLAPLAGGVDIPTDQILTAGNASIGPSNPLKVHYPSDQGWLYVRPEHGRLRVCSSAGTGSSFAGWFSFDRWDAVFVTGEKNPGDIEVYASEDTVVQFVAGYAALQYDGQKCNEVMVSPQQLYLGFEKFNGPKVECYVDLYLREDIKISGTIAENFEAFVCHNSDSGPKTEKYTNSELTGVAVALKYSSSDPNSGSGVRIETQNKVVDKYISLTNPNYLAPGAIYDGGYNYKAPGDRYTNFNPPANDGPPLEIIIPCVVVGVIVIVVIIVVVVICVKRSSKGVKNCKSSSSSSSDSSKKNENPQPPYPEPGAYAEPPYQGQPGYQQPYPPQ